MRVFLSLISLASAPDIFDIFNGAHAYRDKPYLIFARNSVNFYAGSAVSIRLALKIIKNFHLEEVSLMAKKYCYLFTEGNAKMRELLGVLRNYYDYIIVDLPPVLPVPDAMILSKHIDGYLIVVKSGTA